MAPPRPPKQTSGSTMSDRAPTAVPARQSNGEPLAPKAPASQIIEPVPGAVNRKKQKRRQKQAARQVSEQRAHNGYDEHSREDHDYDSAEAYYDENESVDAPHSLHPPSLAGEHEQHNAAARKAKKKKGRKSRADSRTVPDGSTTSLSTHSTSMTHPLPPPLPPHVAPRAILKSAKDRSIWNTSTQEERENIKAFWLELGEDERRQLVKVEKDAVLKKMKEQQKHSCSCTVCGRKRTAIEEELEVLYDAYYEELEQYANTNQDSFDPDAPIVPPPRLYQPPLSPSGQHTGARPQFHPSRGRFQELPEDDDGLEDDEEEDEEEDDDDDESYSDEEFADEDTHAPRADLFAFGNSLTVKDGILTVADDLLKNDGKHFIDMMEQLAERRMQREEDTQYGIAAAHQSFHDGHNHGPLDEDDYDDEEDDEDYDSQEEEDYEEDEMDAMTEEQRMEEGRRMFQIFAARMFEQRVLTAYREKVAEQRQQKLIEELMEEESRNEQRSAKKAREAQKKKDKKRLQRQAKEEEKARRDAEKTAAEEAAKAEQEKKLEEQRRKREEQRKKREAERKAQEEERARKEAEKQRRLREERERQAEAERKQREQKERQEKEKREKARRKEREEREAREKKAKEDRERKAQEEQARKDREEKSAQGMKASDKRRPQGKPASQSGPAPVPSSLQNPQNISPHFTSPHHPVATPVVPKASTPAKHRQLSQQDSHTPSPVSQPTSGEQLSISPRSIPLSQSSAASSAASRQGHGQQPPVLHHPQPSTPLSPLGSHRSHPPAVAGLSGLPTHPPSMPGMAPRPPAGHELPAHPPQPGPPTSQFRSLPASSGIPPGFNGARMVPPSRAFPFESGQGLPPHGQQPMPNTFSSQPGGIPQAHSRQPSSSIERSPLDAYAQPSAISRPKPITRPSSTAPQDQHNYNNYHAAQRDIDNLSAQLGSSALLDDAEPSCSSNLSQSLPGAPAPGSLPPSSRASFSASSVLPNPGGASKHTNFPTGPGVRNNSPWGVQPFGGFPGAPTWEVPPGSGWSNIALGSGSLGRAYPSHVSRPAEIRMYVIQACNQLSNGTRDFHDVEHVARRVNQLRPLWEPAVSVEEVQEICDTEGNSQNGGGSFAVADKENRKYVKFEPGNSTTATYSNPAPGGRGNSNPGEIGSPIPGGSGAVGTGIGAPSSSFHRQFASPPAGF